MKSITRNITYILLIIFSHASATYSDNSSSTLIIQSTTSTRDSGLYDYLIPHFNEKFNIKVKVIAVGTGQAINNARNCDGDILIVHSRQDEEIFIKDGYGTKRENLMYNDFVIVGPKSDPLNILNYESLKMATKQIALGTEKFISRGDDSGTHKAEMRIWKDIKDDFNKFKQSKLYLETGQGMGSTLNITVGLNAYTFVDRATWLNFKNKQNHIIVYEKDPRMKNQYGIILVNADKCKNINKKSSMIFYDWILSTEGKNLINNYQINGKQLFFAE